MIEAVSPAAIHLGHRKLLPKKALAPLVNIEAESRASVAKRSLPFPVSGTRFISVNALDEVVEFLDKQKTRWDQEVSGLVSNYEDLKNQQFEVLMSEAKKLGADNADWLDKQAAKIKTQYPPVSAVNGMFRFGWHIFKINSVSDSSANALLVDVKEWAEKSVEEIHKELGAVGTHVLEIIASKKKLHEKNVVPLLNAFKTFQAVEFSGKSEARQLVDEITAFLISFGTIPEAVVILNSSQETMATFQALLEDLATLENDSAAKGGGLKGLYSVGEFKRLLDI
jgi:predicted transcriptional regulator